MRACACMHRGRVQARRCTPLRGGDRAARHGRSSLRVLSPSRRRDHSRGGRGGLCSPERFRWQSPCWVVQRRVLLAWAPRASAIRQRTRHDDDSGNLRARKFETDWRCRANPRVLLAMRPENRVSIRWRSPEFSVDRWGVHRIRFHKSTLETFDTQI